MFNQVHLGSDRLICMQIDTTMGSKANSWWPARIPKLTERRQMLKERQSQIFEVGIEFSVT